jgi:hypothetical protein
MTQNEIIYTVLQGNKTHRDLVKESKEIVSHIAAPVSGYHIKIGNTDYFPRTEKRFKELQKLKKESEN